MAKKKRVTKRASEEPRSGSQQRVGSRPEAALVPEVEREAVRVRVDMWDQECGSEGTVSNAVRRYTAQWGLPPMREEAEGEKRNDSEPGQSATSKVSDGGGL